MVLIMIEINFEIDRSIFHEVYIYYLVGYFSKLTGLLLLNKLFLTKNSFFAFLMVII